MITKNVFKIHYNSINNCNKSKIVTCACTCKSSPYSSELRTKTLSMTSLLVVSIRVNPQCGDLQTKRTGVFYLAARQDPYTFPDEPTYTRLKTEDRCIIPCSGSRWVQRVAKTPSLPPVLKVIFKWKKKICSQLRPNYFISIWYLRNKR